MRAFAAALLAGVLLALALPLGGDAVTLNVARLANPHGSNVTAANSTTPLFILDGDGGAAHYAVQIDGTEIGTFVTGGGLPGQVLIATPNPLAQGPHTLTFTELSPRAGFPTTPLGFSVDTIPAGVPTITNVVVGPPNASGNYPVTVYGSAPALTAVRIYGGFALFGGTVSQAGGSFVAALVAKPAGTYSLTAASVDTAGNYSERSAVWPLTVGAVPPPPPPPAVPGPPVAGTGTPHIVMLSWTTPPDGGSPITGYVVTWTVSAINAVGEGGPSSLKTGTVAP